MGDKFYKLIQGVEFMKNNIASRVKQKYWLVAEGPRLMGQLFKTAVDINKFKSLPKGSNRPTLVIPGFATTNASTYFMRKVLTNNGHNTIRWFYHRNVGLSDNVLEETCKQVLDICDAYGTEINIVGQSLGGCFARAAANMHPECVNAVVTLGSPINSITRINKYSIDKYNEITGIVDAAFIQHSEYYHTFYPNPDVPCSSMYSYTDGVVHWSQSITNLTDKSENIVIKPSHFAMGFDFDTLVVVADRLSRNKDTWERWPASQP